MKEVMRLGGKGDWILWDGRRRRSYGISVFPQNLLWKSSALLLGRTFSTVGDTVSGLKFLKVPEDKKGCCTVTF